MKQRLLGDMVHVWKVSNLNVKIGKKFNRMIKNLHVTSDNLPKSLVGLGTTFALVKEPQIEPLQSIPNHLLLFKSIKGKW